MIRLNKKNRKSFGNINIVPVKNIFTAGEVNKFIRDEIAVFQND
jgi:hypothetical protein